MKDLNSITVTRRTAVAAFGAAVVAGLGLTACGGTSASGSAAGSAASGTVYKIGVLQLTQHAALDAANEGFIAALSDAKINYNADQQNASNDQSTCQTIASQFVGDGVDLIYAIATPAAQAAAGATTDIPIVGCAITDYAESGLVKDNDKPGTNVTGASDLTPVVEQIDMIHEVLPDAKTVGLLYASNEANSKIQIDMAKEELDKIGLSYTDYTVSSSNDVQSVVESAVGKVDVLYSPTDNTIAAAAAQVGAIALENKIPFVPGEEGMFTDGQGLFTLSIDYKELGRTAGEMAIKILKGEAKPEDMAIETTPADKLKTLKNEDVAKELGVDLSALDA